MTGASPTAQLTARAAAEGIQRLVVGAVVANDDAVLLLRRPAGDFMGGIHELPSGKVEPDETIEQALIREVREETGLTVVAIGDHLGSFDYTSASGHATRQLTFPVQVAASAPVTLTEHDAYQWAPTTAAAAVTDEVGEILTRYRAATARPGRDD